MKPITLLYIGDIMGKPGLDVVSTVLPSVKREFNVDIVIAQAENVSDGKGLTKEDFKYLRTIGIDFCTGGNWTTHRSEIHDYLSDPQQPVIRPANYPAGTPGRGWKILETKHGKVLIVSLLGKIVGRDADKPLENPLTCIDTILSAHLNDDIVATIVNFHGDYSSEKRVIGYYLDGRVSAALGDHWHVPTADAMILPRGTAHQTDVGMCGTLHSSLGIKTETIITRWKTNGISRNELETTGAYQFNGVVIVIDPITHLALSITPIQRYVER
ncbi:MAG: TIGR00282 family metallophosphoesterase [Candidatus Saccharimonadales bacterium]